MLFNGLHSIKEILTQLSMHLSVQPKENRGFLTISFSPSQSDFEDKSAAVLLLHGCFPSPQKAVSGPAGPPAPPAGRSSSARRQVQLCAGRAGRVLRVFIICAVAAPSASPLEAPERPRRGQPLCPWSQAGNTSWVELPASSRAAPGMWFHCDAPAGGCGPHPLNQFSAVGSDSSAGVHPPPPGSCTLATTHLPGSPQG